MGNRDALSGLFWMAIGLGVCWGGVDLELGTLHDPGSGFIFFWVGIIMIGLAAAILIRGIREKSPAAELRTIFAHVQWKKVLFVLGALIAYALTFYHLGFVLTTIFFLIFLFKAIEPQRWSIAIGGAILSALTAYAVFHWWLGTQLPQGILPLG
ncbi:MAG: tripartite tricarboxylate transporter TctB family protein [Thermodesulfobacteriota bacterium]